MSDMQRDFMDREALIRYVSEQFPHAVAVAPQVSATVGGRQEAERRLNTARLQDYSATRNFLDGAVTHLSPYIRYGVLNLAEVRDYALANTRSTGEVEKFINELGCRDYWQRLYIVLGDGIWDDQEDYKTGFLAREYADVLPEDIRTGTTGIRFIDDFVDELVTTGYLHNHARMWLAAYVVHWRRVKWQAGARWFLEHLLDGDPASNNLSWQWVASTFSHKPYFYNIANVVKYTGGRYAGDPEHDGHQDFVGSYATIAKRLFPHVDLETEEEKPSRDSGKRR